MNKDQVSIILKLQDSYIQYKDKQCIFQDILTHFLSLTESEYGFIGEVSKTVKNRPYFKPYAIADVSWNKTSRILFEFSHLNTLIGHTIRTRTPVISNDPVHNKRRAKLTKGSFVLTNYLGIPLLDSKGECLAMCGIANRKQGYSKDLLLELQPFTHAISKLVEAYRYDVVIQNMAQLDPLTHLFNREHVNLKLDELIKKHRKKKSSFCLFMLDLKKFKLINTTYGHYIGDELLILFSKRIKQLFSADDFFARVGGNEFFVILENKGDCEHINAIASRLSEASNLPYEVNGNSIQCGLSMGIACYPVDGKSKQELLKHLDVALYDAKKRKIKFGFSSKETKKNFDCVTKLNKALEHAFLKQDFFLVYQPQIHLKTKKIIGLEALIRWDCPKKGIVFPDHFISSIEDSGNAEHLNIYVVTHMLQDACKLKSSSPLKIAVNISPCVSDFKRHIKVLVDMIHEKQDMLNKNKLIIEFEITESSFIDQKEDTLNIALKQAKKDGIRCSVDDFGVAYSSIDRLTQYPFDTIKIDKTFTQRLDQEDHISSAAIIKALIQLSDDLGFTLIAEGSETKAQVEKLMTMGCIYAQGFYFYKPALLKEICKLIRKN